MKSIYVPFYSLLQKLIPALATLHVSVTLPAVPSNLQDRQKAGMARRSTCLCIIVFSLVLMEASSATCAFINNFTGGMAGIWRLSKRREAVEFRNVSKHKHSPPPSPKKAPPLIKGRPPPQPSGFYNGAPAQAVDDAAVCALVFALILFFSAL